MAATRIVLMASALSAEEVALETVPAGCELVVAKAGTPGFLHALGSADCLVGFGDPAVDDAAYRAAPGLKLYQLLSSGYDRCDIGAARRAGVPICNNGGANSTAVAEHALMLMLAVSRRLVRQHASVAAGRWRGNDLAGTRLFELRGKTLGIVGLGAIGRKVARLASAFGMAVLYYDLRRLSEDAEDSLGVRFRLLNEVLREADIVSLHVPLTAASRGMVGAAELGRMKSTAYLVNTCRGPVVDEAALVAALTEGRIAGAGLDVFDVEPPAPDNPLFSLPNVVLTPHFAGPTSDNQRARFRNAFDNCQRVARGEAPLWVIPELAG